MKGKFWQADWFVALAVVLLFLVFSLSAPLQSIEQGAYDWGVQLSEREANSDITIIAIDDSSIENLGRWPWPRDLHAQLIQKLQEAGAKLVVYDVFFTEPQLDPGLAYIEELGRRFDQTSLAALPDLGPEWGQQLEVLKQQISALQASAQASNTQLLIEQAANRAQQPTAEGETGEADVVGIVLPGVNIEVIDELSGMLAQIMPQDVVDLSAVLGQAQLELDADGTLAGSIAVAGNVVLPQFFIPGEPLGNPDQPLADYIQNNAVMDVSDNVGARADGYLPLAVVQAVAPIELFGAQAAGIGHLNSEPDADGAVRSDPLAVDYYGQYFPSLSLVAAARSLNLKPEDIKINLGEGVQLGRLNILTDKFLRMHTFFYADKNGKSAFSVDTFFSVITDQVTPEKFKNKIVLIGPTATGVGQPQVTPIDPTMAPVVTLAHSISSLLNEDFFIEPDWALWVLIAAYVLVALYLIIGLPRLKAGAAAVFTVILVLVLMGTHLYLMSAELIWVKLALPAVLLVVGHVLMTTKRFLVTEKSKLKTDAESAESNKMLALQYQGQGQLDMAFDKFQRIPLDDGIMGLMYNLALDYESKRKMAKARMVYEHMGEYNPKYKDIATRMETAKNMEATIILGGGGGGGTAATMILDGGAAKPTLGRYDIEKELGKGAMGVVYLGKDPKINRVVAIKTMALSAEFEGDELEEAKGRFFREAESAGRLNHPNIVTIYDAGEEHDLAFIAMEFLTGVEMTKFLNPEDRMSVIDVLNLTADCADALAYADSNNVVHRDIKPANIIYDEALKKPQITDFGIARVTDASKTKTGMVLGTPSYMSPEQLAGAKVDGRSDLFSLGVMFYQLLTCELPFTGDSMATLMYRIANEPHPDISTVRSDLTDCVKTIVDKAMAKDLAERYVNGTEMARELRACAATLDTEGEG